MNVRMHSYEHTHIPPPKMDSLIDAEDLGYNFQR